MAKKGEKMDQRFIELKLTVSKEVDLAIIMRAKSGGHRTKAAVVRQVLADGLKPEIQEARQRVEKK